MNLFMKIKFYSGNDSMDISFAISMYKLLLEKTLDEKEKKFYVDEINKLKKLIN